jgi:hypothetical protein
VHKPSSQSNTRAYILNYGRVFDNKAVPANLLQGTIKNDVQQYGTLLGTMRGGPNVAWYGPSHTSVRLKILTG